MYSPTPPLPPNMLHTTITHATTYLVFIFSTTSLDYSFATHKILGPAFHHPFLLISRGIHLNLGSEEKSALVKTDSHLSPLATSGLLCWSTFPFTAILISMEVVLLYSIGQLSWIHIPEAWQPRLKISCKCCVSKQKPIWGTRVSILEGPQFYTTTEIRCLWLVAVQSNEIVMSYIAVRTLTNTGPTDPRT